MSEMEDPAKAGQLQERHILELAKVKPPKHMVTLFYSSTCPHCFLVIGLLKNFLQNHPGIMLIEVDATTETGTKFLEAMLKGGREVPVAIVDNRYIIKGDANFTQRFSYAVEMSERTLESREDMQRWLLRR